MKKYYKSYTFWFNVAVVLAGAIAQLSGQYPDIATLAQLAAVANIVLRFKTVAPISL